MSRAPITRPAITRTLAQIEDMTCGQLIVHTRHAAKLFAASAPAGQLMALADAIRQAGDLAAANPALAFWVAKFRALETEIREHIPTKEIRA